MSAYLTAAQVAYQIGEDVDNVRRRLARGQIAGRKLGNRWRVTQAAVDAFMAPNNKPAPTPRLSARQMKARAS